MLAMVLTVLTGITARGTAPGAEGQAALRTEAPARSAQAGAKVKSLKVISQEPGRPMGAAARGHQVIRGPQELAKVVGGLGANIDRAVARLAKMLHVESIDWKKQMVVIVSGGTQKTGGYKVEVTGLKVNDDMLTVQWKLLAPRPGEPVTQATSHPALTLLVERYDDEIRFDPSTAKSSVD